MLPAQSESRLEARHPAREVILSLIALCSSGCVGIGSVPADPSDPTAGGGRVWSGRGPLIQGFLGATAYDTVSRTGSNPVDVEGNSDGLDRLPLLGAGGQWKLGAEGFDYGLDGFLTAQGRSNAAATATGQTSSVPIDVDVLAIDLCAGPFLSQSLGERFRVYGGAGPLLQLAEYEQHRNTVSEHGSGLGLGAYVRGGIDWILPSRTLIGLGARWSDTRTSLSGGLGDLKMEGFQLYLTIGRSF